MATRRSPRLKGSPKPELPHKPRPPKRVQNAAEDSVRQANFQVELAEWQKAKAEHDKLMQNRKRKQNAATKAAARKQPCPPAALAPPPELSADSGEEGLSTWLVCRPVQQLYNWPVAHGPDPRGPLKQQLAERFPRLRRSTVRWIIDVEAVALRCGYFDCCMYYPYGEWFDCYEYGGIAWPPHPAPTPPDDVRVCCCAGFEEMREKFDEVGGFPPFTAELRARQWARLEGCGQEPTKHELDKLKWPQCCWWDDRDRIGACQSL